MRQHHIRRLGLAALAAGILGVANADAQPADPRPNPGLKSVEMDLSPLDAIVGDKPVVIFGEDSHGMAAEHSFVRQAFQRLVERKGFRVFVFEAQWGLQDVFADFMASDRTTLTSVEQFFLDGAFVSEDTTRMLIWIRDWNRAHPDDPILITGFQPEQPVTDTRALLAYLKASRDSAAPGVAAGLAPCRAGDPQYQTDLDFLSDTFKRRKSGHGAFDPAERAACLAGLKAAGAFVDREANVPAGRRAERELARLHVDSLTTYVKVLSYIGDGHPEMTPAQQLELSGYGYGSGDKTRFEIFNGLGRLRYGDRKVFFWMHNWHAARHASETGPIKPEAGAIPKGTISVGERLAKEYGRKLVVIGSIVPCGGRCAEPDGSLEPPFTTKYGDRPALVDLRDPSQGAGLPIHRSGPVFANHHGFGFSDVRLDRQFDALLYLPSSAVVR